MVEIKYQVTFNIQTCLELLTAELFRTTYNINSCLILYFLKYFLFINILK
jgi:hypothetical protein